MKRKISSFITAMFIMLVCVFASACGNKYKNMEFKIYYAFSEDVADEDWLDGTDGISLNYDPEGGVKGTSLVFGDDGIAHLYIRVEINGVKAKHIDSITVSSTSVNGLGFSTASVEQNEVLDLQVMGNVNTTLKFYENNSGKKFETSLVISKELEGIVADTTIQPAMTIGLNHSLNLLALNNLTYLPLHQTNQLGVNYTIEAVGAFEEGATAGVYEFEKDESIVPSDYFEIRNGKIVVINGDFDLTSEGYAVEVKATSIYHDGSKDGEEAIFAKFYVYLAESDIVAPVVKYADAKGKDNVLPNDGTMHLYENGGDYATSSLKVLVPEVGPAPYTIYQSGVNLQNGKKSAIVPSILIKDNSGEYSEFDFSNTNHQAGVNGLIVNELTPGVGFWQYEFSIADRNIRKNNVKIAFDLGGLDFSYASNRFGEMNFVVDKGVLPNAITVNDVEDYPNASLSQPSGVAYATKDESYKGLELKLTANPNEDSARKITLSYNKDNVIAIYDDKGYPLNTAYDTVTEIYSGQKIYIKFRNTGDAQNTEQIKIDMITSVAPYEYNGQKGVYGDTLIVPFNLKRVVTADKFEFVANGDGGMVLLDAGATDASFRVKVYSSGTNFDAKTVTISSNNPAVTFNNFATEVKLDEGGVLYSQNAAEGYREYLIPVLKIGSDVLSKLDIKNILSEVAIKAGDFAVNVSKRATIRSVFTATEEQMNGLKIVGETKNVQTLTGIGNFAFNYAIPLRERAEFRFDNSQALTQTIQKLSFDVDAYEGDLLEFDNSAVRFLAISNSAFEVNGNIAGKTQISTLKVSYYDKELMLQVKEIPVQIAVYDKVARIDVSFLEEKSEIGYINPYYTEISSTSFNYRTYTSSYATPVANLAFLSADKTSVIPVENFVQIKVDDSEIDKTIFSSEVLLIEEALGNALTSGMVNVALLKNIAVQSVDKLVIKLIVSRFDGQKYNSECEVPVSIMLGNVQTATGISADVPVDSNGDLAFSYMDVPNGGSDLKTFKVKLDFDENFQNGIRFENIEQSLTYIIYRYELDINGNIVFDDKNQPVMTKIEDEFFRVQFKEDGTMEVAAYKGRRGGRYCLVLATKDSYVGNGLSVSEIESKKERKDFLTTLGINISVSDGTKIAPFKIYSTEDLKKINNNLTSYFVLAKNIDVRDSDFEPIGKVGTMVNDFNGGLNGEYQIIGDGKTKYSTYAITIRLDNVAESTTNGTLVGLFASLGEDAVIKNLNLNVEFATNYSNSFEVGMKVGALAGVNKGLIENVSVNIQGGTVNLESSSGATTIVNFGGVAGLNSGDIVDCSVNVLNGLTLTSSSRVVHNIGLMVGTNAENGEISGKYVGKDSLDNFVFDVKADLQVKNQSTNEENTKYFVGTVAGENKGTVANLLVGGRISFAEDSQAKQTGAMGGFVGNASAGIIDTVTALSLDILSSATKVDVAGVAGVASGTILMAKFVSANTNFGTFEALGQVYGNANVAGIVANSQGATVVHSSVESFVQTVKDNVYNITKPYPTIVGGESAIVAGLVAQGNSTLATSFVNANLEGGQIVILTTETDDGDTYFIGNVGKVEGDAYVKVVPAVDSATYSVVNGVSSVLAVAGKTYDNYIKNASVNASTTVWDNIYIFEDGKYSKATQYIEGKTYKEFDYSAWITLFADYGSDIWAVSDGINVASHLGMSIPYAYLKINNKPLMIVAPQSIRASVNVDYVTEVDFVHVVEFNIAKYNITETVLVNFLEGAGDEGNEHNLFASKDGAVKGLLNSEILPVGAQGGLRYQILGTGYRYAHITDQNKIVFTGASREIPILVRIYSVFNPELEAYVVFYSHNLFTDLKLSASSLRGEDSSSYEINLYTGQSIKQISLSTENLYLNDEGQLESTTSLFDVYGIGQYLNLNVESNEGDDSQINIQGANFDDVNISIKENASFGADYEETLTFSLYLKQEYYNLNIKDYYNIKVEAGTEEPKALEEDILLATIKLKVRLYNVATGIRVNGDDAEKTTHDDISFEALLTTSFVNAEATYTSMNTTVENGEVLVLDELGVETDSIKIKFEILEGEEEVSNLKARAKVTTFADLFDYTITREQYLEVGTEKILGYNFHVHLELKEQHDFRFIENNIKFNIVVCATSKEDDVFDDFEITLKPTVLSTATIENYAVKNVQVGTDYTNIISNTKVPVSIIEPGSLGNVMLIYLEPTYSEVKNVSIKTSELYVPSLGRNVRMKFTQLVYDERMKDDESGIKGAFATLYGGEDYTQQGDTLQLELVSEIDINHNRTYNGIIALYVQLEKFPGFEGTLTAELNVETSNGKIVTRTRNLLTTYLPEVNFLYDESRKVNDGYLIQEATNGNEATLQVYGYQFNSNPVLSFAWHLTKMKSTEYYSYTYVEDGGRIKQLSITELATGAITTYKLEDRDQLLKVFDGIDEDTAENVEEFLIGDYVKYYLTTDYDKIVIDRNTGAYEVPIMINVSDEIPASFSLTASMTLTTQDGQLRNENQAIVFYPVDYLLNSVQIDNIGVAVNEAKELQIRFITDNKVNDLTKEILSRLVERYDTTDKVGKLFTYYSGGKVVDFTTASQHPEFEFKLLNGNLFSISGISDFNTYIDFDVDYGYVNSANGRYSLSFGDVGESKSKSTSFRLNIAVDNSNVEVLVYSADEIFDSSTGTWKLETGANYVLMNDIELENVVPITTNIGKFDGNNRIISIKSFRVNDATSEYGLFARIGTYTMQDNVTLESKTMKTILRNVIVDYSKFDSAQAIALNNNTTGQIVFGGLVAVNNGGLIYNCDVMNMSNKDKTITILVPAEADVVFGGLVGQNMGIITNSRVGRDSYTRVEVTPTYEGQTQHRDLGGLQFELYNQAIEASANNHFTSRVAGFAGTNGGTISTSYVAKTSLINYSNDERVNKTAGFVAENNGGAKIEYSYVEADDATINSSNNPYARNYVIKNTGNGIVAGFVHTNAGEIRNTYANTVLETKSAYIAGFVYSNTGTIGESYAACEMNSESTSSYAEQPFVGMDSANNLLSNGTIENSFYLMRSTTDTPYYQGDKDVAYGLNEVNFQNSEYLVGFSFVLSNVQTEREQGIWSYYSIEGNRRILPELINADTIAHSYRYVVDEVSVNKVLKNATNFAKGTKNNPHTISSVEEFNDVFTEEGDKFSGYVRFINDIDFNDDETAIGTRSKFTLGKTSEIKTSIEGNGMTISGIYLEVDTAIVEEIGLFAKVQNAYIKNLNLEFAVPTTDGQFSTTTATYSGGLAGKIDNSLILNIKLNGASTTLTGRNYVGGLAGMITGRSLVYGVTTNLNVKATSASQFLYYNETDYNSLNIQQSSNLTYNDYLKRLSFAGGLAGVIDLKTRSGVDHNVQYVDILGSDMSQKTFDGATEANILAEYAGGVAGYAGAQTSSYRVRYFTGKNERIQGDTAVGGLYGVSLGGILASQVTTEEDKQFVLDTNIGDYIEKLTDNEENATMDVSKVDTYGNLSLLASSKYAGGLVGIALNSKIRASYSKVGIVSGEHVGGIVGMSVAGVINYSYSIPYINISDNLKNVGGLIGSAYGVQRISPDRNKEIASFEALVKQQGVLNENTDIQFTYSTLILQNEELLKVDIANTKLDYVCANYRGADGTSYLASNAGSNLVYVYAGIVNYKTKENKDLIVLNETASTGNSAKMDLYKLFAVEDPIQTVAFNEVFAGWAVMKYWSLRQERYFPLLTNEIVDNYIDIDNSNKQIIGANPEGNYRIIGDLQFDSVESNWVFSDTFKGTIIGERESDGKRPVITINQIKPNLSGETSGFFKETRDATISNIEIRWGTQEYGAFDLSGVTGLGMVSGFTCLDTGSLFSNVQVSGAGGENNKEGYILKSNTPIAGFGGIVGSATNTSILACGFAGKVDAVLSNGENSIFAGGLVGVMSTQIKEGFNEVVKTSTINNSRVGIKNDIDHGVDSYPITQFNYTVKGASAGVYIGGLVGQANNIAISTGILGELSDTGNYKIVDFTIKVEAFTKYLYAGGLVGMAQSGYFANSSTSVNLAIAGTSEANSKIMAGGFMGDYSIESVSSNTTGIINCSTQANVTTFEETIGSLEATADSSMVMLSTGVATLSANAAIKQCLFNGKVDTEKSSISILFAGGVVAQVDSIVPTQAIIEEVMTTADLIAGTSETKQLYVGGFVGQATRVAISYSSSWGRIVPITSDELEGDNDGVYVGGMIGQVSSIAGIENIKIDVKNSYTLSSIISDSIAPEAIKSLDIGALVGRIPKDAGLEKKHVNFAESVYYSSDYALTPDENYVGNSPIGKNLGAETIAYSSVWHEGLKTGEDGKQNSHWVSYDSLSGAMPYIATLENLLYTYEVIVKDPSTKVYQYRQGSAMRPIRINSDTAFESEYSYYILDRKSADEKATPKMTGVLKGVLIGRNFEAENTFELGELSSASAGSGIIAEIGLHSAVSNVHIHLNKEIQGTFVGIIAGVNKGMIFNCSVQGHGIKSSASRLGLIAYHNQGIVSHSYSSAEIIESKWAAGIVYQNDGKLLSNYFTGYIEADDTAAGIFMASGTPKKAYAYNNYMAGVINADLKGGTAFANIKISDVDSFNGENNYIDKYSDTVYGANTGDHQWEFNGILRSIESGELMSGKGLAGQWYYAAKTTEKSSLDVSALTFGYNYNYPVYKFNKLKGNTLSDMVYDDLAHIIATGDSGYSYSAAVELDDVAEKDDQRYAPVYRSLLYGETMEGFEVGEIYENAIKIPHLGVLASINSLPKDENPKIVRSYVMIYDMNGNGVNWESTEEVGGFRAKTFNGVMVSNKYFDYQEPTNEESQQCLVTGLSMGSLLGNIQEGYVGNLNLGSFSDLVDSGAIASSLEGAVKFNHIEFAPLSELTGIDDGSLGGLAGIIKAGSELRVANFSSIAKEKGEGRECDLTLSKAYNVGLIAGKSEGSIYLEEDEKSSRYAVKFSGGTNVGGVVGELAGGMINANGNIINLIDSGDKSDNVNMLGGVAGLVSQSDGIPTIVNVNVNIMAGTAEKTTIKSNGFGGVAGKVTGDLVIGEKRDDGVVGSADSIKISAGKTEKIEFIADADSTESFYGLIIGIIEGDVTVNAFMMDEIKSINVLSKDGKVVKDNCGVGALVGGQKSGSLVFNIGKEGGTGTSKIELGEMKIFSSNVHNLGAVMGYYVGGSLDLGIEFSNLITLNGIQNVGGIIGYVDTALDNISKSEKDLFNSDAKFATIEIMGDSNSECQFKNFGGLIGYWKGTNNLFGADGMVEEAKEMVNKNDIVIYYSEPMNLTKPELARAENVGGVVGYLEATGNITKLTNEGSFTYFDTIGVLNVGFEASTIKSGKVNNNKLSMAIQLVNVGGVIGNLTTSIAGAVPADEGGEEPPMAEPMTLSELRNSGSVAGYQNVGGLVGLIDSNDKIVINNCGVVLEEGEASLKFDNEQEVMADKINAAVATVSTGLVKGILNVGGAFGAVKGSGITISKVATTAKVLGNANVGGLIGLAEGVYLSDNIVQGLEIKTAEEVVEETGEEEPKENVYAVVKGVYYTHIHLEAKTQNGMETLVEVRADYLPTSVGGFVGKTANVTAQSNLMLGVEITSSQEGAEETAMISTISNYIFNKSDIVTQYHDFTQDNELIEFGEILTGFGGFAGTVDGNTMDSLASNYLVTPKVSAQIGVNVGTYYGVLNANDSGFEAPILLGEAIVSGAYNIGGIIGFINYPQGSNFPEVTNSKLNGEGVIKLQTEFGGMYVGGIIGRTRSNNVAGLELIGNKAVNIQINTNGNYYIGGLVGRAEMGYGKLPNNNEPLTFDGQFDFKVEDGKVASTGVNIEGSQVENFGGLIGMLKVAQTQSVNDDGFSVDVSGKHTKAFTINTIENSNYWDGESRFDVTDDDDIVLQTEAYYVNKDHLSICATSDTSWYGGEDGKGKANSPFDENKKGWAKEYSAFRQLQRCIPQDKEVGWDSITVVYDAAQINHVGTIGNLGIDINPNLEGAQYINSQGVEETVDPQHICFTVYQADDMVETLYSAMGIASLQYYDGYDNAKDYRQVKDDTTPWYAWGVKVIFDVLLGGSSPYQEYYIDCNNPTNNLQALSRFNFGTLIGGGNKNKWKDDYITLGGSKTEYQNTNVKFEDQNNPELATSGNQKYVSYFVKDYLGTESTKDTRAAEYEGKKGAYFVFDIVYDNASLGGLPAEGKDNYAVNVEDDSHLPNSGSMFEVNGIYSEEAHKLQLNQGAVDWYAVNVAVAGIIVDIVIMALTCGVGGAVKGGFGAIKTLGAKGLKEIALAFRMGFGEAIGKKFIRNSLKKLFSKGGRKVLALIGIQWVSTFAWISARNAMAGYQSYTRPTPLNFGYLSSQYTREISYEMLEDESIVLAQTTDRMKGKDGSAYTFYSATRPYDFHINKYVGDLIGQDVIIDTSKSEIISGMENIDFSLSETEVSDDCYKEGHLYQEFSTDSFTWVGYVDITVEEKTNKEFVGYIESAKELYSIYNKYIFSQGQYYISVYSGKVEFESASLQPSDTSQPKVVTDEEYNYYVHGEFVGETYQYSNTNSYPGNNLTYSGGKYYINGKEYTGEVIYTPEQGFTYVPMPEALGLKGYDYFEGAYYTENGIKDLIYDGEPLVKYAKFEYSSTQPSGTEGVDYISGSHLDEEESVRYVRDDAGAYYESSPGVYSEWTTVIGNVPRYRKETYHEEISGFYEIVEIKEEKEDFEEPGKYDTWKIVPIYPASFTVEVYREDKRNLAKTGKDNIVYAYKEEGVGIEYSPTYYIWEGGYVIHGDAVVDGEVQEYPMVFTPASEWEVNSEREFEVISAVGLVYDNGKLDSSLVNAIGGIPITIEEMMAQWSTGKKYQNYYSVTDKSLLSDMYQIKDGTLYSYDSRYTIDENARLVETKVVHETNKDKSMYENMYLTNANFGFYTRYRYVTWIGSTCAVRDLTEADLNSEKFWRKNGKAYSIIPEDGTVYVNGGLKTVQSERARVVLGGDPNSARMLRMSVSGGTYIVKTPGSITVK